MDKFASGMVGKFEEALHCDHDHSDNKKRDKHHYHHHHQLPPQQPDVCHVDDQKNITINVHVDCSCCGTGKNGNGGSGSGQPQGRPTHTTGTSDGSVKGGLGAPGGILKIPTRPPSVWPGTRTQLYLPFIFIRAAPGDKGARPIVGTFWESPDIIILPGVAPSAAPATPPANLGGVADAGKDNTIYAHVWNLGQAPAHGTRVEFYWFNPTLGFNGKSANLIGTTYADLAGRGSPGSHKLVKCPHNWRATYLNGGHECLVVRIFHPVSDRLSDPAWDASQNRHIGQRNIHVMTAAEAAANPTLGINVGPLFQQPAQVAVRRADTTTMPWLHLFTNSRTKLPDTGAANGQIGITAPIQTGAALPKLGTAPNPGEVGLTDSSHTVLGDDKAIGFNTTDGNPGEGKANVYRVTSNQDGTTVGGYTVVILGK